MTVKNSTPQPSAAGYPRPLPGCDYLYLNENIELRSMKMQTVQPSKTSFAIEPDSSFELEFHLAGYGECEMIYSQYRKETLKGRPGVVFLSYNPEVNCCVSLPSQPRFKTVNLYYKPVLIRTLFDGKIRGLPEEMQALVNGEKTAPFNISRSITGPAYQALQQLFFCPYQGELATLYRENKALELLFLQFGELTNAASLQIMSRFSRPAMMNALYEARDILKKELENPPGISQLARRVGICETYLKQGFREVFGTTVHGCLMDFRLDQAQELLARQQEADLSRIACRLGFYDAAHFSRHFKKRFGVSPGVYAGRYRK